VRTAGSPSIVALIPARQGSKRVPGKNVRVLNGHPAIAYTIAPAVESGVFESVIVSTDSVEIASIARHYGAEVPFLRPAAFAGDTSPDIKWLTHMLSELKRQGRTWDCFSLLRPTSPFRSADTIHRAWTRFIGEEGVDSLRAVEKCAQHPGKMWIVRGARMFPLLPFGLTPRSADDGYPDEARLSDADQASEGVAAGAIEQPWHSTPYQALPPVYVQNASLEIAWTRMVFERGTIAGDVIVPFITEGYEGFDINDPHDWMIAERLLAEGVVRLPPVGQAPYDAAIT
jgi:CMP-N,N'-diacetyllegionaminic acid synthase